MEIYERKEGHSQEMVILFTLISQLFSFMIKISMFSLLIILISLIKKLQDPHDILSNNLEDSVGDFHVTNAGKNRKRKNQIIDDDEVSDGGSNQYTKHV